MTIPLEDIAVKIGAESGLGNPLSVTALSGGRNNRVARVEYAQDCLLLKQYFHSDSDQRNRLNNEFSFATFAWNSGCRKIARPVFRSDALRSGLYEFIDGERGNARATQVSDVEQATDFVLGINARKAEAHDLPLASEAGFSVGEHVENTARRVERLRAISGESAVDIGVQSQVRELILPLWDKVTRAIRAMLARTPALARPIHADERWISPSDFGFHNSIERRGGELVFVDFEFAGWDDPVKLVCDFANQPDNILPDGLAEKFAAKIFAAQPSSDSIQARHRLLQPVFQIKWICIILNHFLPSGSDRNRFTNAENMQVKKIEQVTKMEKMLYRAEHSAVLI